MEEQNQSRQRFLLVCQGLFCMGRGSYYLMKELRRLEEAGELPAEVKVQPYYCFNGCSHGPNMVCYPDKIWFERVNQANLAQVLAYLRDGTPATDPALNQKRVLEVVRHNTYTEIEKELNLKPS
jgi:(2Fe-2S) ferredoxin